MKSTSKRHSIAKWSKEERDNYNELRDWIADGWYDHCIDQLIEDLKAQKAASIKPGDIVIIDVPGNSQFAITYNALRCRVLKANPKSVSVRSEDGKSGILRLGYEFVRLAD